MRILKIELQNINSLRSDQPIVIDFEGPRFQDVGLFAITGSTGAGKTTLLDAITIALYHRVPRFNQPHIKGGLSDVISYGASEAMSRVTFLAGHTRYESFWAMRVKQGNGKVLASPQETVRLKNLETNEILVERKRFYEKEIEEITQLNYQQFLRSMMLAQGEFAAFLSAPANEKGTLLEQITGEVIYKKIGDTLGHRLSEEERKLNEIRGQVNIEDVLGEEQIELLNQELASVEERNMTLTVEGSRLERVLQWYKKDEEARKQGEGLGVMKKELVLKKEQSATMMHLLARHLLAEPMKDLLLEISQLERRSSVLKEDRQNLDGEIHKLNDVIRITDENVQKQREKLTDTETSNDVWQARLVSVDRLDTELDNLKEHIGQKDKVKEVQLKQLGLTEAGIETRGRELHRIQEDLSKVDTYLNEHATMLMVDKKLPDWTGQLTNRKNLNAQQQKGLSERKNYTDEKNRLESCVKDLKPQIKETKDQIENLAKEVESLEQELKGQSLEKLLQQQQQLHEERNGLRELYEASQKYIREQNKLKEYNTLVIELSRAEVHLKAQMETNSLQQQEMQKQIEDAEKILELEQKIKGLEEERRKLEEGKPCPLCGSTQHPLIGEYAKVKPSESASILMQRKEKAKQLENEEKLLNKRMADCLAELKQQQINIRDSLHTSDELQQLFRAKPYDIADTVLINSRGMEIKGLMEALNKGIDDYQKRLQYRNERNEELSKHRQDLLKAQAELTNLEDKVLSVSVYIEKMNKALEELEVSVRKVEADLNTALAAVGLMLVPPDESDSFIDGLKEQMQHYRKQEMLKMDLIKNLESFRKDISHLKANSEKQKADLELLERDIHALREKLNQRQKDRDALLPAQQSAGSKRAELRQLLDKAKREFEITNEEREKLIQRMAAHQRLKESKDQELKNTLEEMAAGDQKLSHALEISVFASKDELRAALLSNERKAELETLKSDLDHQKARLEALENQWQNSIHILDQKKDFESSKEEALKGKESLESEKAKNMQRLGQLRQLFETDRKIKDRNRAALIRVGQQEKTLKKYKDLYKLLGGSKDSFNRYVQRLTLKNLIHLANRHLYDLNKRYSLKMNETYKNGEELNFMLVDHYQTEETRLVDTSSGGEKFLISLALALGLSDLASRNVSIGSLFIDEGFGTLDSKTLETVISTLSTLQAQGKMIGVISHVDSLKERIPVQIQVEKKQNGVSGVTVI